MPIASLKNKMGAAILLAVSIGALWGIVLALQFLVVLFVTVLGIAIWSAITIYRLSFLGLYFILGEANTGWAIFGAMGLGTFLLSLAAQRIRN